MGIKAKQRELKTALSSVKLSDISYDGKGNHPHFLSPIDMDNILSKLSPFVMLVDKEAELPITYQAVNKGKPYKALVTSGMGDAFREAGYVKAYPLEEK